MIQNNIRSTQRIRKIIGISVLTIIAIMHLFRVGNYFNGDFRVFYYSYVSDIIIPFGVYFLLCITEFKMKIFQKWYVKATFIIGLTTLAEILQFYGIYALGTTFDPIDIIMYVLGVGVAVVVDRLLLKQLIPFWDLEKHKL